MENQDCGAEAECLPEMHNTLGSASNTDSF